MTKSFAEQLQEMRNVLQAQMDIVRVCSPTKPAVLATSSVGGGGTYRIWTQTLYRGTVSCQVRGRVERSTEDFQRVVGKMDEVTSGLSNAIPPSPLLSVMPAFDGSHPHTLLLLPFGTRTLSGCVAHGDDTHRRRC